MTFHPKIYNLPEKATICPQFLNMSMYALFDDSHELHSRTIGGVGGVRANLGDANIFTSIVTSTLPVVRDCNMNGRPSICFDLFGKEDLMKIFYNDYVKSGRLSRKRNSYICESSSFTLIHTYIQPHT